MKKLATIIWVALSALLLTLAVPYSYALAAEATCKEALSSDNTVDLIVKAVRKKSNNGFVPNAFHVEHGSGYISSDSSEKKIILADGNDTVARPVINFGQNRHDGVYLFDVDTSLIVLELSMYEAIEGLISNIEFEYLNKHLRTFGVYFNGDILAIELGQGLHRVTKSDFAKAVKKDKIANLKPKDLVDISKFDKRAFGATVVKAHEFYVEVYYSARSVTAFEGESLPLNRRGLVPYNLITRR